VIEAVRHTHLLSLAVAELKALDKEPLRRIAAHYADGYARLLRDVRGSQGHDDDVSKDDVVFGGNTMREIEEGLLEVILDVRGRQRLPVVNFAAGGLATPADAALMMQMGCDGVFVGSGIFKSDNPAARGRAVVEATTHFDDPKLVAKVSEDLGEAMKGLDINELSAEERLQERGW
jgi:pyridoxal 5'-phosphate synthase pdxS subunit